MQRPSRRWLRHRRTGDDRRRRPWQWTSEADEFLGGRVGDLGRDRCRRQRGRRPPARALRGARARARRRPTSWPSAPAPHPRYVTEWLRGQAAGGYVDVRRRRPATYSLTEEQAFALADPDGPIYAARRVPARAGRAAGRAADHRGVPHRRRASAGTSTTRTCSSAASSSSGPATSPTWSPSWIPALDGVEREAARRRAGRRHRLRARRVARAARRRPTRSRTVAAPTTTTGRSSWPASGPPTPGVADRVDVRGRLGADLRRHRLRPGDHLRLPARHGRPARRRPARPRGARAGRHLADRRAVAGDTRGGQPQPRRPGLLQRSPPSSACPTRCPSPAATRSARRPARRRSGRSSPTPASPGSARAAETPFNLVYEVRP